MESLSDLIRDPSAWAALATLIAMEVVLGIDNLIFVAILTGRVEQSHRRTVRRIGIGLALVLRLALLATIASIVKFTAPLFMALGHGFSWRDLVLLAGGLFLVWKATSEIHHTVDPTETADLLDKKGRVALSFGAAIVQILALDVVFSIDSILTAVGMTEHLPIMMAAVIIAVGLMLVAAGPLARFIHDNPSVVMLALGFLLMIGMTLIAEGFGTHVPKGYIYAAMAFSAFVEGLNMLARARRRAVRTHHDQ